jgi:hypothetical protein
MSLSEKGSAKDFPSSAEEGWTRQQEKYREATFCGADGVVLVRKSWPTPPRLRGKDASQLFLTSRSHPSSAEEGKFLAHDELLADTRNISVCLFLREYTSPTLRESPWKV